MMNKLKIIYTPSSFPDYEIDYLKEKDILMDETIVLVPDQYSFETEKRLVKELGKNGLFNVQVYGLKKFVYEKAFSIGVKTKNILSSLGKELIIMRILKELNTKLKTYKGVYSSQKYASAISKQIDSLRMDCLDGKFIKEMADSLKPSSVNLSEKLEDIALILDKYNSYMNSSALDEIDLINRLTDYYLKSTDNKVSIVVDGFTGMSSLELNLISALASSTSGDCFFRVVAGRNGVVNKYSKKFIEQIKSSFFNIKEDLTVEEYFSTPAISEQNAFQFAELFDYKKNLEIYDFNFRIASAIDKENEMNFVALDILKQIKEKGYEWKHFAVLCTDINVYRRYFEKAFSKFNIPFFLDINIPVMSFNFISFIVNSLRAVASNFERKSVVDTIKVRSFISDENDYNSSGFDTMYRSASYIERHALKFRISYNSWNNISFWEEYFLEKNNVKEIDELSEDIRSVLFLKNEVFKALINLQSNLKKSKSISEMSEHLREYLESFSFFDILQKKIEACLTNGNMEDEVKKLRSIDRAVNDVIEQMNIFSKDIWADIKSFADLTEQAFSSYTAGLTPPEKQTVIFGNIERTKLSECKVLYIVGANDGLLPSEVKDGATLFSGSEINALDSFGVGDFKTKNKFMDKEIFDVYDKIIHSSDLSVFTYSKTNDKGENIEPSNWVKGILEIGKTKVEDFTLNLEKLLIGGVIEPYFERKVFNLAVDKEQNILDGILFLSDEDKNLYGKKLRVYSEAEKLMNASISKNLHKVYADTLPNNNGVYKLSISKLETQATCPFKYYVSEVLNPSENPDTATNSAKIGIIVHLALSEFVEDFLNSSDKDKYFEVAADKLIDKFNENADKEDLYKLNSSEKKALKLFEYSLRNAAKPLLMQVNIGDMCRISSKYEQVFSHTFKRKIDENKTDKNILSPDRMSLVGIIDRLDIISYHNQDYIRIIDYKTGNTSFDTTKIINGLQLQLATYLEAIIENSKPKELRTLGMFYTRLKENTESELDDSKREEKLSKAYGLDGIFIDDKDILSEVDSTLKENGTSHISKVSFTKDGISKKSPVVSEDYFKRIFKVVDENRWRLLDQIVNADISISPYKDSNSEACTYCEYKNICKMDSIRYRDFFRRFNDEELK